MWSWPWCAYSPDENNMQFQHRIIDDLIGHKYNGSRKKGQVTPHLRYHGQFLRKDDASAET